MIAVNLTRFVSHRVTIFGISIVSHMLCTCPDDISSCGPNIAATPVPTNEQTEQIIKILMKIKLINNIIKMFGKKKRKKNNGLSRDLNPGPLAPKARIIPLDH